MGVGVSSDLNTWTLILSAEISARTFFALSISRRSIPVSCRVYCELDQDSIRVHKPSLDHPLPREKLLEDIAEGPVDRLSETGMNNQILVKAFEQDQIVCGYGRAFGRLVPELVQNEPGRRT